MQRYSEKKTVERAVRRALLVNVRPGTDLETSVEKLALDNLTMGDLYTLTRALGKLRDAQPGVPIGR